ncbi:DUF3363 domain-containing protein [Burkholderia sp. LMU1-1-1.1]
MEERGAIPFEPLLAPWKPAIKPRSGQQLAATVRGGRASWQIGRQLGLSVGSLSIFCEQFSCHLNCLLM